MTAITRTPQGTNAYGQDTYRAAPRGAGWTYEITRNGPEHAFHRRAFEVVRVGPNGERDTLAASHACGAPRTLSECESIIYRDMVRAGIA